MKVEHTRKLFYKKFPYKATIKLKEAGFIRYANRKDLERLFIADRFEEWGGVRFGFESQYASYVRQDRFLTKRNQSIWNGRFRLFALYKWLDTNRKEYPNDINIRNEGDSFTIFTTYKDVWENFVSEFKDHVNEIVWPKDDNHTQYLLDNPNNIICTNLPYGKYRYKVNLKTKHDGGLKGLRGWIKNYDGEIQVAESLLDDLERGYTYLENRGLYIMDNSMITLLQMFLGNNVRSITEYITEDELDAKTDK